jgi:hypothetical protein
MPAACGRFRVCLLHAVAPVVCCILCGVCAVLRTGCRVQCFAHAAARPLRAARRAQKSVVPQVRASSCVSSAACCTLSVACVAWFCRLLRGVCCMPHIALLPVALLSVVNGPFSTLSVACCTLHVACCMLHVALHVVVVRCMLLEVWRMLPVARCMSFVVRCVLSAACRMLSRCCLLHAACRQLHFPRCMLHGCIFCDACCMLSVVCCLFSGDHRRHAVRWIVSAARSPLHVARSPLPVVGCRYPAPVSHVACRVCCLWPVPRRISSRCTLRRCVSSVACCMSHVLRCMWSVFYCLPECPTSHGVRCLSRVPTSHLVTLRVLCCATSAACCTLHVPLSHVVSWPLPVQFLHVVCRMPSVARCRVAQRRHTRSASRRRSPLSSAVAGEPCCIADRGARACACVRVGSKRDGVSLWVGRACVGCREGFVLAQSHKRETAAACLRS